MVKTKITCVVDNTVEHGSLFWGEHGVSFRIETDQGCFLFDTGRSESVLWHNLGMLGRCPRDAKALVLSHAHTDHTGALLTVLSQKPGFPLYASPYARILDIPIAVLGILNYLAVVVLWAGQKAVSLRWANLSALGLLGLTLFGTLFSIYLTCLELFVIHAICAWCLSSAVVITLLMLLAAFPITSKES